MIEHFERGKLLYEQGRYDMAEAEFRAALVEMPDFSFLHAHLALSLSRQKRYEEGVQEARIAIEEDPEEEFGYWALADILEDQERYDEAAEAIEEAIRLDPEDASNRDTLARIRLAQKRFAEALASADAGLEIDAEHMGCMLTRGIALMRLNRLKEAQGAVAEALVHNPESAGGHSCMGHVLLHQGNHQEAMAHFKEALRIEPSYEDAREGIVTALKARNPIYRFALWYLLLTSRTGWLGQAALWGVLIVMVGSGELAKRLPALGPWVFYPVSAVFIAFWFLILVENALFNMLLRFDRLGRLALSDDEVTCSNWTAGCMVLAVLAVGAWAVTGIFTFLLGGLFALLLIAPIEQYYKSTPGIARRWMLLYLLVVILVGAADLACFANLRPKDPSFAARLHRPLMYTFIFGAGFAEWIAGKVNQMALRR